jgi:hypothetical protein
MGDKQELLGVEQGFQDDKLLLKGFRNQYYEMIIFVQRKRI